MTGSALTHQSVAPTVVWLREHEPDVYARTAHLVGSYDWVLSALGADVHVERNWAMESGLFTIDGYIADAVLTAAGLDARYSRLSGAPERRSVSSAPRPPQRPACDPEPH